MRRLITGDIHARFDALQAVLKKAAFDKDEDILYSVGDLCDRGEKPAQTLAFLSSLPNFRPVMGNHDIWLEEYLLTGLVDSDWLYNGGVWYYLYNWGGMAANTTIDGYKVDASGAWIQ